MGPQGPGSGGSLGSWPQSPVPFNARAPPYHAAASRAEHRPSCLESGLALFLF